VCSCFEAVESACKVDIRVGIKFTVLTAVAISAHV